MRCAPVALFCLDSLVRLVEVSRASARVTHHDPKAQSSCVILNAWIKAAICRGIRDGRPEAFALLDETERALGIDWSGSRPIKKMTSKARTIALILWKLRLELPHNNTL
jgi:ADP-ribosylglycohydrolase